MNVRDVLVLAQGMGCKQRSEVRRLLQQRFNISIFQQILYPETRIPDCEQIPKMISQLSQAMPLSRVVGEKWFYDRPFSLNSECFEPRPETELIITKVRQLFPQPEASFHFIDLGCGTGVLAITILSLYPHSQGLAIDCSAGALETTKANAQRYQVADRLQLHSGRWFESVPDPVLKACDLIVSNPPYVTSAAYAQLPAVVKNYDPMISLLDQDQDGCSGYRAIQQCCQRVSRRDKQLRIVVEHGADQQQLVRKIFSEPPLKVTEWCTDQFDLPRVVLAVCPA